MGSSQVKVDDFSTLDEALEIEFLLYEPKREDYSLNGIFTFDTDSNNITVNTSSSGVLLHNDPMRGAYKVGDDSLATNHEDFSLSDATVDKNVVKANPSPESQSFGLFTPNNIDAHDFGPAGSSSSTKKAVLQSKLGYHEDYNKTNRRQGNKAVMWTQTEVSELVEGVAKLGTEKWSNIKMVLSDSHRAPKHVRRTVAEKMGKSLTSLQACSGAGEQVPGWTGDEAKDAS